MSERMPVLVVAGVDREAAAVLTAALSCDVPDALALTYDIDVDADCVTRMTSDLFGCEQLVLRVGHLCPSCLIREDVLPTLLTLAAEGRSGVVLRLPMGLEPAHLLWAIQHEAVDGVRAGSVVRIASVMVATPSGTVADDLVGDGMLLERGVAVTAGEERGVGETLARMIEIADGVVLTGDDTPAPPALDLLRVLVRPGGRLHVGAESVDVTAAISGTFDVEHAVTWADPSDEHKPNTGVAGEAWVLRLQSTRPLHPRRLVREIEQLACGRFRIRGCAWLPSRPGVIVSCDGAGGQLTIGAAGWWGPEQPMTRLVVVGLLADDDRTRVAEAFRRSLLTDSEIRAGATAWPHGDGLEPWLGAIDDVDAA